MSDKSYLAGNGAIYVQPFGPNTEPKYLGCHTLGDVDEPQGDLTLVYCPNPANPNTWVVDNSFRGEPGTITTSIETLMRRTADYLESLQSGGILYVHEVDTGRKDLFTNRGRGFAFDGVSITTKGGSNWAVRDPASQEVAMLTFDVGAESLYRYYTLYSARKPMIATEEAFAIAIYGMTLPCEMIALGMESAAAASPEVILSTDFGTTFAAAAADPLSTDDDIAAIAIFSLGSNTVRILVAKLDDATTIAEAAYSDDCGATWATAAMGAVVAEAVLTAGGLVVVDPSHIWAVGAGGAIYFSSQGGAVWEVQAVGGAVTSSDLNAVDFIDDQTGYAVGATVTALRTLDGGIVWEDISSDLPAIGNLLSVAITPSGTVWIGSDDGSLIYSAGSGICGTASEWVSRAYPLQASGAVTKLEFMSDLIGWMVVDDQIYRTVNGGWDWEIVETPTNSNLNDIALCNDNQAWSAGVIHAGTTMLVSTSN